MWRPGKMRNFDHNSGEYLDIDGAKIYCEVAGNDNSPALLVLHGGFGNIEDLNTILSDIDKEFKVIGIDSRGHGKSTLGSKVLTYEQIQKDVERVLEYLNIDTVSIIGIV
jgi:pimeloyl-ACP methyl ester carboxylesterase